MGKKAVLAGCCALIGAIFFAVAWTSPKNAIKEDPILAAYDRILNDLTLVEKGEFGMTRIPKAQQVSHFGILPTGDPSKNDFLRVLQEQKSKGLAVEHGFIPVWSRSDLVGNRHNWRSEDPNYFLFGAGARKDSEGYIQAARKIGEALDKRPDQPFEMTLGQWRIVAKAVPYRHKECISCHKSAKVGDVAGNVAVAYRTTKN